MRGNRHFRAFRLSRRRWRPGRQARGRVCGEGGRPFFRPPAFAVGVPAVSRTDVVLGVRSWAAVACGVEEAAVSSESHVLAAGSADHAVAEAAVSRTRVVFGAEAVEGEAASHEGDDAIALLVGEAWAVLPAGLEGERVLHGRRWLAGRLGFLALGCLRMGVSRLPSVWKVVTNTPSVSWVCHGNVMVVSRRLGARLGVSVSASSGAEFRAGARTQRAVVRGSLRRAS